VVTYNTIIDFDNPDTKLFPGMTAYVTIPVASATNVVKVPNGALRFKPDLTPDQMAALEQQAGITPKASARQGKGQGAGRAAGASSQLQQPRTAAPETAIVWKLTADKQLVPVQIATGITDHTFTEVAQVLHGSISQGEQLVVGSATSTKAASASNSNSAPGMGGAPRVGGR
jgi:HlyD family secretion protein